MANPITEREYRAEIKSLVRAARKECKGRQSDIEDYLYEQCQQHEYVIYDGKALCVLLYSVNESSFADEFGADAADILKKEGWSMMIFAAASFAMYKDCLDAYHTTRR